MTTLAGTFKNQQDTLLNQGLLAVQLLKAHNFEIPFIYGINYTDRNCLGEPLPANYSFAIVDNSKSWPEKSIQTLRNNGYNVMFSQEVIGMKIHTRLKIYLT